MTLVARMPIHVLEAIMGAIRGGHQFDHADARMAGKARAFVEVLPAQEVLADEGGELLQGLFDTSRACTSRRMSRMSR